MRTSRTASDGPPLGNMDMAYTCLNVLAYADWNRGTEETQEVRRLFRPRRQPARLARERTHVWQS